jgi:plasmid stabilization system protein ParE
MVKRIIWSDRARKDKRDILEYWFKRNGNKNYSRKLAFEFRETFNYIAKQNYLGRATDEKNIRVTVCRYYQIFYEITQENIEILSVWDSRRNPDNLKLKE